jgi:hypothetical protein
MATEYQTKVKLFIAGAATEWIVGAVVCLYDRDRISRDDYLGTNSTNMYRGSVLSVHGGSVPGHG